MIYPTLFEETFEEISKKTALVGDVAELIEVDVADGKLVDGKTYQDIFRLDEIDTPSEFGIHLMVKNPMDFLKRRVQKATRICTQIEGGDPSEFIKKAKELGYEVGLSIKLETDNSKLDPFIENLDYIQFMSIKPGGKGRIFKPEVIKKIKSFKEKYPAMETQVDGGINTSTLPLLLKIGVNHVVMNTAIFGAENPKDRLINLRKTFYMGSGIRHTSLTTIRSDKRIKRVAFLGGADWKKGDDAYDAAFETAKLLAQDGYEIINGGGPGVMQASTEGAHAGGGKVLAITYHPNKPKKNFEGVSKDNFFDEEVYALDYFDRTKVMLQNTDLHIVFKGATGTISEFGMMWASSRIHEGHHKPIVVYGDFWEKIIRCFEDTMNLRSGEKELLHICKTPEEVLEYARSME